MPPSGPDASNAALPVQTPVVVSTPPVPSPTRGDRCVLDGKAGRLHKGLPVLAYTSGKMIVARTLNGEALLPNIEAPSKLDVLVYRGHAYKTTACKLAPSGAYMASGDERGMLRVWAFDHEEHLCKYDAPGLSGPIRGLDWDEESKRIAIGGERADARSECARVIQWDTGVTVGQLSQHLKGRVADVAFKPNRPFRIVTAGKDDSTCHFHKGPPFQKIPPENEVPAERCHSKGAVNCVEYSHDGSLVVSVGSDRSICTYDGKTLEAKHKLENVHSATIYSVAWSGDGKYIMTASGDGTCKAFSVSSDGVLEEKQVWKPAEYQLGTTFDKVPLGGIQLGCTFVQGDIPVSVGLNGQISILPKVGTEDSIQVLTGHNAPISGLAVDSENGVFYTGDSDGILCKWSLKTCKPVGRIEPAEGNQDLMSIVHSGAISGVAATADGNLLSIGWDDKLFVTDKDGKVNTNAISLGAQPSAVATGTKLAVIATVQGLLMFKDGSLSCSLSTSYEAQAVCVSKDDKTVYVGGSDCNIHIYEVDDSFSLKEKHVIENGHLKPIFSLALSNDGKKLAAGDSRDVVVWNLDNYEALVAKGRWCFHTQKVTCLSWSPDDRILASGGADDSIFLWCAEKKMKRIHYKYAHRGGLTGIAFLNNANMEFISVGMDAVVNKFSVSKDVEEKFG